MKAPFEKTNLKRQFQTQLTEAATDFINLKAEAIEVLMEVKNVDVGRFIEIKKEMKEIYDDSLQIVEAYENIFGETLEMEIAEKDLSISTADVLSQAVEIEDEEDED